MARAGRLHPPRRLNYRERPAEARPRRDRAVLDGPAGMSRQASRVRGDAMRGVFDGEEV